MKKFEEELNKLTEHVIEAGDMILEALRNSTKALTNGDIELANQVIENDRNINRISYKIESSSLKMLLLGHPVATDLRIVSAALKISTDLDRIGDQAKDICDLLRFLLEGNIYKKNIDTIIENLNYLESSLFDRQSPFLVQVIWRSEDHGPFMANDAMDAFVWSDMALTRLILNNMRALSNRSPTRPYRACIRLYRIIASVLRGEIPNLYEIIRETSYKMPEGKEYIANGNIVNRMMSCERLTRPIISAAEVVCLGSNGFEDMIMPERRLDMSVYQAVRELKG